MRNLVRDLALAIRHWRRAPALAIVAILVMGLGTAGALTLFGVLDVLMLRPLPLPRPDELVEVSAIEPRAGYTFGLPAAALNHLAARQHSFQTIAGFSSVAFATGGAQGYTEALGVTSDYFSVLGLTPAMGRLITPADVARSAHVAVVGDDYWRRQLQADPHVIGRTIAVQGVSLAIVGVMPKTFLGLEVGRPSDLVMPIGLFPAVAQIPADVAPLALIARLRPNTLLVTARAEMQALWPQMLAASVVPAWSEELRQTYPTLRVEVRSAKTGLTESFSTRSLYGRPLSLLALAGLVVLALACMNVSTLLLARSAAHEQEIGIRAALGASRAALVRQVILECLLLSTLGTLAGLPIAAWSARRLLSTIAWWASPGSTPFDLTPDVRVTLVVLACAMVAGLIFGALPAYRATRPGLVGAVRSTWAPSPHTLRWGRHLLIAQIVMATVLFVSTLLVAVNLHRLTTRPDVPRSPMWIVGLSEQAGAYANGDARAYYRRLVEALTADGAIDSAVLTYAMPFDAYGGATDPDADRQTIAPAAASPGVRTSANIVQVTPGLFQALGLPAPLGRDFRWDDDRTHAPVAIVSGAVARAAFGSASAAIGRHIRIGETSDDADVEIVGVTGDAPIVDLHERHPSYVLRPLSQMRRASSSPFVLVRSRRTAADIDREVARRIEGLGYDHVVWTRSLTAHIDAALLRERLMTAAATYFAVLAGALLMVGLAGMMSYHVARRTREIGIRSALGASSRSLQILILRESLFIVLVGLAIGLPAAWMASGLLRSSIAGMSVHAPFAFAGAAAMAISIGVLAAWLPARRAAAISPLVALRSE
jgi:predicted permease